MQGAGDKVQLEFTDLEPLVALERASKEHPDVAIFASVDGKRHPLSIKGRLPQQRIRREIVVSQLYTLARSVVEAEFGAVAATFAPRYGWAK